MTEHLAAFFGGRWPDPQPTRMPVEIPDSDRLEFARLLAALNCQRGVEVGVERGAYSEVLCQAIPGLHLTLVDPWQWRTDYRPHVTQAQLDAMLRETRVRLAPYQTTVLRLPSVEAARCVEDESLDFVYLDGLHDFANVVADIAAWAPKVRSGGIVSGHDFSRRAQFHVRRAVYGWTDSYAIRPWYVLGREDKVQGERRDGVRTWFWVQT